MGENPQNPPHGPDDELELPVEDGEGTEVKRHWKSAAIPGRSKSSGLVRRQVSVGDLKRGAPERFEAREPAGPDPQRSGLETDGPEVSPAGSGSGLDAGPESPVRREAGGSGTAAPVPKPIGARADERAAGSAFPRPGEAEAEGWAQGRRRRALAPEGEEAWTGSRSSLWFVLAGLVCIAVIGYFVAANFKRSTPVPAPEAPKRQKLKESIEGIPIAEFVERSAELLPVVAETLAKAESSSGAELAGLVRGGAESAARRQEWRARGVVPARHLPLTARQLHAAAVGDTGYLVLAGLDADYLVAAAYFVKIGEDFKYDWEASEGYSELLPGEVETLTGDEPKLMRVVVSISDFYTTQFPESDYNCYSFHHQDPGEFVWGFAKRGSLVDRSLRASFRSKDLRGTEERATVKVRKGPAGARANQLEVVEFLHTDWLTP